MLDPGAETMARVVRLLSEDSDDFMTAAHPTFEWADYSGDTDDTAYEGIHTILWGMDSLIGWGGSTATEVSEKNFYLLREAYNELLPSYLAGTIMDEQVMKAHSAACATAYKNHTAMCDGADMDIHGNHKAYKAPKLENYGNALRYASLIPDLFACKVAGMRPQGAAYSYLPDDVWDLFDACGPERKVGPGNPYKPGEYRKVAA